MLARWNGDVEGLEDGGVILVKKEKKKMISKEMISITYLTSSISVSLLVMNIGKWGALDSIVQATR